MYFIESSKISDKLEINDDIQSRMQTSPTGEFTKHLLLIENSIVYAFISFDTIPDCEYFSLYEIYVSSVFRKKNIGTVALKMIEEYSQNLGYKKIVLYPSSLDSNIKDKDLINWYKKNGYKRSMINDVVYEKLFF